MELISIEERPTAENVVEETPLPHANSPPETPQSPFDDVMVKLSTEPESVYVASVCVDQVPKESKPPVTVPVERMASMVALAGNDPLGL